MKAGPGKFVLLAVGVTVPLVVGGEIATYNVMGAEGSGAATVGCSVSLLSSLVAGWWVWQGDKKGQVPAITIAFGAIGLRLLTAAAFGLVVLASELVAAKPALLWTAFSYLALLVLDTRFLLAVLHRAESATDQEKR